MKKIYLASALILLLTSSGIRAQFYSGGHDSLLFDGGRNISYLKCGCWIAIVSQRLSPLYGSWCEQTTEETCGYIDTVWVRRKGLIPLNVREITDSDTIRTLNMTKNHEIILQLQDGKIIDMGHNTSFYISKDYCETNIDLVLHYGLLYLDLKRGDRDKSVSIKTERGEVINKGTRYTVEIVKEGDIFVDIVKVYEGSVTFRPNMQNETNKKEYEKYGEDASDKNALLQKLTEDYQSGKITAREYVDKLKEITAGPKIEIMKTVTVEAGYVSRINGSGNPTEPVAFDVNEDRWWKDK